LYQANFPHIAVESGLVRVNPEISYSPNESFTIILTLKGFLVKKKI
jgi:hypothetical protein